jgi:hypothetical protein
MDWPEPPTGDSDIALGLSEAMSDHPLAWRAAIQAELVRTGGRHLIFVCYAPTHSVHQE